MVTPEGTIAVRSSWTDGRFIGVASDRSLAWYPVAGGEPRPLAARLPPGARGLGLSRDRRFLFIEEEGVPARLDRLELTTGRRLPGRSFMPDDAAGVVFVAGTEVNLDGTAYAYRYLRFLQDLYLVEGLR